MTHKERVLKALLHEETDRVPFMYRDIPEVRTRLKRDLQLHSDDELFEMLDIDFRWVEPMYIGGKTIKNVDYQKDIWGIEWKYTRFNDHAGYWNEIEHPLANVYDISQLDEYPWPCVDDWDFSKVEEFCDKYSEYAIMTAPGIASPGIFQTPIQQLLGVERALTEPYVNPDFFQALVDKVLSFHISFIDRFFKSGNGKIDFFRIGDDFGTQQSLLFDIDTWKTCFQQPFRQMAETAKKYGAHYYQHCCGSIRPLIPIFIETGVEVLDPIQVTANDMNPETLKKEFGHLLTFSGGVDEQHLLPFGTPEQVKSETRKLIDIMSVGGGFFLGSTHNFQDDTPTENIIAMYEGGRNTKL